MRGPEDVSLEEADSVGGRSDGSDIDDDLRTQEALHAIGGVLDGLSAAFPWVSVIQIKDQRGYLVSRKEVDNVDYVMKETELVVVNALSSNHAV